MRRPETQATGRTATPNALRCAGVVRHRRAATGRCEGRSIAIGPGQSPRSLGSVRGHLRRRPPRALSAAYGEQRTGMHFGRSVTELHYAVAPNESRRSRFVLSDDIACTSYIGDRSGSNARMRVGIFAQSRCERTDCHAGLESSLGNSNMPLRRQARTCFKPVSAIDSAPSFDKDRCRGARLRRWMGGRAVEGTGLENRQACKRLVGSNPTPSATRSPTLTRPIYTQYPQGE